MNTRPSSKRKRRNVEEGVFRACLALIVVVFGYGVFQYPYAPIRLHDDGRFRDKIGHEFTEAQFQSFTIWERCLYGSFAIFAVSSIPFVIAQHRRRTK